MNDSRWRMQGALTLRFSAAFSALLAFLWTAQLGWPRFSSSDALSFLPYAFVVLHPKGARLAAIGLGLGCGVAASIVADFVNGFMRTKEAHVVFASVAAANLLLAGLAIKEAFSSKQLRRATLWLLVLAGFLYVWICALI